MSNVWKWIVLGVAGALALAWVIYLAVDRLPNLRELGPAPF